MAKLLISTQVYENYGAHDWDGQGECPQSWRAKGGNEYIIKNFKGNDRNATELTMVASAQIEQDDQYFREHIIDFRIVADDYLTEFEKDQLEYEGRIYYPAKEIVLA